MRAIVLSGGGNMGPVQVGALKALLECGLEPQMIVGCSAGALNAGFLAREVSLEQVKRLAEVWRSVTTQQIYPGSRLSATWRLLTGKDSLYDNRNFYAFLQRHGTTPALTFETLPVKLYITATHLHSGRLHVFGDNVHERVLDAMMASTALTPMHPPWEVNGERYIDGRTVTPLPLRVAMDRGATEIYAFHILDVDPERVDQRLIRGVAGVLNHSVGTMLRAQAQHDLLLAEVKSRAKLHYIPLMVSIRPDATDFSQAQALINEGYQITVEHFNRLKRNRRATGEEQPIRQRIAEQVTRLWPRRQIHEPVQVKVNTMRK